MSYRWCKFDILPRLIGLGYGRTEAYKEAVAILQFQQPILLRFNKQPVL